MSIAVITDIHGNRHALEAALAAIAEAGCEETWCLGDLVGYGADPDACVELARAHAVVCLAGNHDLAVTGGISIAEFSSSARIAAEWTRATITPQTLEYLQSLQPLAESSGVGLFHASPRDPIWEYVLSPVQAGQCLDVQKTRVALIGHSHVALSFSRMPGESVTGQARSGGEELTIEAGEWLLNPGSVGQPRDGDPRAAWLELDLDRQRAVYRRVDYDIAGAAAAIRAAGLPDSLAERLQYGQ